jgi:hypothetical protein
MDYAPNVEACNGSRDVWPLIRARRQSRVAIVGSNPTPAICRLASRDSGVTVTGVETVPNHLWNAALCSAIGDCSRRADGVSKLSQPLPAVITSSVHEVARRDLRCCRVADAPDAFARSVLELLAMSGAQCRASPAVPMSTTWIGIRNSRRCIRFGRRGSNKRSDAHEPASRLV